MARLLFKLNGIPDDEADEIRALLDAHPIDYYETDAGRFGIAMAAIWLPDEQQLAQAQQLLEAYQRQRYQQARERYEQQQRDGTAETHLQRFLRQPIRSSIFIFAILVILYFTTAPFVMWIK